MEDSYTYIRDLRQHTHISPDGILSQTLQNDERCKVVLFGFAAGQELSAHRTPYPALLVFLKGEGSLRLGADDKEAGEGTFVYMPPNLEHGVRARTDLVMLLAMLKQ